LDEAQVVPMLRRAIRANLTDKCRSGCVIKLPAVGDVLVAGDMHGSMVNLRAIFQIADLEANPGRHLVLQELVHGGPKDPAGGCRSVFCLLEGVRLKVSFPDRVHIILGNHELSESHGVSLIKGGERVSKTFDMGLRHAFGDRADDVKRFMHAFIDTMPIAVRTPHGVFISHSTPKSEDLDIFDVDVFDTTVPFQDDPYDSSVFALVWGRDFSWEATETFARMTAAETFVVGHTSCANGYRKVGARHLIIDSTDEKGCFLLFPLDRHFSRDELAQRTHKISKVIERVRG